MTQAQVEPSPEGVPGAVSDPTRIAAWDLTFPTGGAGAAAGDGDRVNAYPEPAAELWQRVVPFLARHLQGAQR